MLKNTLIITALIMAAIALGATTTYITLRRGGEEVTRQEEVATTTEEPAAQLEEPVAQPKKPITTQPEELKQPTTTQPIDTSDWKTYRNEEYGFEIQIPPGFVIDRTRGSISSVVITEFPGTGPDLVVITPLTDQNSPFRNCTPVEPTGRIKEITQTLKNTGRESFCLSGPYYDSPFTIYTFSFPIGRHNRSLVVTISVPHYDEERSLLLLKRMFTALKLRGDQAWKDGVD